MRTIARLDKVDSIRDNHRMSKPEMRVLVACEFSGVVRDAFIKAGCYAVSCDLIDSERKGPHIKGDVLDVLRQSGGAFDLMIAHPPCTYLASSGLHWNKRIDGREALTLEALDFIRALLNAPIKRIALENPIGRISSAIRKPDQIIQPCGLATMPVKPHACGSKACHYCSQLRCWQVTLARAEQIKHRQDKISSAQARSGPKNAAARIRGSLTLWPHSGASYD